MASLLRFWLLNAVFLGAAIAVIRTTFSGFGGELDVRYTLRELASIAAASLAFTMVYNLPATVGLQDETMAAALFSPGCIAMALLYKATHIVRVEGTEVGLIGLVFAGFHAVTWLLAATVAG